ncbi:metallophosphoesterase family protein [Micromonospora sp. NPDC005203]|uniref:metallophosphoesterase family protein n=1 Tax=Micromonospora sp. NPDC005203 TaxID=3364226 RepID=UPI00368165C9
MSPSPRLRAVSDLHIAHPENRSFVQELHPDHAGDWLLVAGDVAERYADIEWALTLLSTRFATVVWAPGNHELWTPAKDPVQLRGVARYEALVRMCRGLGVITPEDPYPVWDGVGGPATIAPLFVLYDYTFRVPGASTKQESLALAYKAGVVCRDEALLHPDPYPSREAWCDARVAETERRLAARDPALPTVLVNHYPLVREPTDVLWYPEFAQWCGTVRTRDWHLRFGAATMVYGHLHIPRTTFHDEVRFEEVSLGYPREWQRRGPVPDPVRTINPAEDVRRRAAVSG